MGFQYDTITEPVVAHRQLQTLTTNNDICATYESETLMRKLKAVLFDLDGVLVPTTILHKQAWQQLFDSCLPENVAPYTDDDYFMYVDGKPRYDGVASLLESRQIALPRGKSSDSSQTQTICGLGNLKNELFEQLLAERGIEPYDDTVDVLRHCIAQGLKLAVVSSSRNAREVLEQAKIIQYFDEIVDGNVSEYEGLPGKPAPDTFLFAAHQLQSDIDVTGVFEDAVSGVTAAHAGNFGYVVGVNRGVGEDALLAAGADTVVNNLIEVIDGNTQAVRKRLQAFDNLLDTATYPIDEWCLQERRTPNDVSATLFSVSNGTIGLRGEGNSPRYLGNGTFVSGFHETYRIIHPEDAYGLARVGQMIQGVPDASDFELSLDGTSIDNNLVETSQSLDFRSGVATVTQRYAFGSEGMLSVETRRVACLFEPRLVLISLRIHSEGLSNSMLRVDAGLNDRVNADAHVADDPRKGHVSGTGLERIAQTATVLQSEQERMVDTAPGQEIEQSDDICAYRCAQSQLVMAVGVRQYVNGNRTSSHSWNFSLKQTPDIEINRYAAYHNIEIEPIGVSDELRVQTKTEQDVDALLARCEQTLEDYGRSDCSHVLEKQSAWLSSFWHRSDIQIETLDDAPSREQQALRWEMFQLAQATASVPNGISAKGLSGTGYGGHYFWDTEIYLLPFLIRSDPQRARELLEYRYRMLPAARRRAATLSLDGALFPWRTLNGEEASAYFPAGTAQYHIDADISYAVEQYVQVTGDTAFMNSQGIDILVETARMWASLGFIADDKQFHIHQVTGPDEYSALVDDNFYTNTMARFNLRNAAQRLTELIGNNGKLAAEVCDRLHIELSEPQQWAEYAENMFIPYDKQRSIHPQDIDFLRRERWDFKHLQARPLLLHYHSLNIYRKQVIKQPDVVMAHMLLADEFPITQKTADYDYYDAITTGDSTLSAAAQSTVAAEIGRTETAASYFYESLFVDLADSHHNTSDGVHLACAGGVWMSLVEGFAGVKVIDGELTVHEHLPDNWKSLNIRLLNCNSIVEIHVTHHGTAIHEISQN